jgi:hypothetical protein
MAVPLFYQTGEDIRTGDHVLLHGEPGEIAFVLDGESNPADWPADEYGRAIMISEPKFFGNLLFPGMTSKTSIRLRIPRIRFEGHRKFEVVNCFSHSATLLLRRVPV